MPTNLLDTMQTERLVVYPINTFGKRKDINICPLQCLGVSGKYQLLISHRFNFNPVDTISTRTTPCLYFSNLFQQLLRQKQAFDTTRSI
jgi:hypothetical protein